MLPVKDLYNPKIIGKLFYFVHKVHKHVLDGIKENLLQEETKMTKLSF